MLRHFADSEVFLCRHVITQEKVIIEKFTYEMPAPTLLMSYISRQSMNRKILSGISTMHHTINVIRKPGFTWFVAEYIKDEAPMMKIQGNPLPPPQAKYLFYLMTQTLLILHNHYISLNDWRPENFVLCDTIFKFVNYSALLPISQVSNEDKVSFVGDPKWMAPEALLSKTYNLITADIWCLGLYLHFMLTGELLFQKSRKLYQDLHKFKYKIPEGIDPAPGDLISKILVLDPNKRIKIRDILAHKFLSPSVPFPIIRIILERTPEMLEWMDFFDYDIQTVFDKIRSLTVDDSTMIFELCSKCIEKGRRPSDFGKTLKINREERDKRNFYLPDHLLFENEPKAVKFDLPPIKKKSNNARQKSARLHKLLNVCTAEITKRDPTINHVDAFIEDTNF
ncbi:protein kinase [Tritrichomonas foetus]|uniref:Protein kinase n=1 Tax=Tritrichomonas foetus TaxID=1144522 RepID=A0A1J4JGQ2_9EUKA|nr:protein kinase [Tritrichomonas foetus]|eukprot:OHS96811.1 protein kinase [Tritrichomonas foetus]